MEKTTQRPKSSLKVAKLQRLMSRAADLALKHRDAVNAAHAEFQKVFGDDLPEESGFFESATPKQEAASIFNAFVEYAENQLQIDEASLAQHIAKLIAEKEDPE